MPKPSLFTYWYLQLPSLILLALIALLVARLVVSLVVGDGNVIRRFVSAITQPMVAAVGAVTPRIVPPAGVVVCAIVWLITARIMVFMVAMAMGVRL